MANYQRNNRGQFSNGGYNNNNNGGYNSNYNGGQRQAPRKKSGAKFTRDKNGNPCTTGWNKSRFAGFVKFLCVVTKSSVESESQTGNKYISVMVKVQKQMTPEETTNGLMNINTGQVTIQSMGIVLNPKAPNGGYCGRYGKK